MSCVFLVNDVDIRYARPCMPSSVSSSLVTERLPRHDATGFVIPISCPRIPWSSWHVVLAVEDKKSPGPKVPVGLPCRINCAVMAFSAWLPRVVCGLVGSFLWPLVFSPFFSCLSFWVKNFFTLYLFISQTKLLLSVSLVSFSLPFFFGPVRHSPSL